MPTTLNKTKILPEDYSYVNLTDVEKLLGNNTNIPYNIKFSLKPYLNKIQSRIPMACGQTKAALAPVLEDNEHLIESNQDNIEDIAHHAEFQTLLGMAIPSLLYENELSYISSPFKKNFIVKTASFQKLFNSEDWQLKIGQEILAKSFIKNIQHAGIHILNKLYNQNIANEIGEHLTIINKKTKAEKHFKINLRFDFIDVKNIKPLPKLSQAQINFLLKNQNDLDLWLKHLPQDTFEFSGFTIGNLYDITDIQVLSELKNWLNIHKDLKPNVYFNQLSLYIKSYIDAEDLTVGGFILDMDPIYKEGNINILNKSSLSDLVASDSNSNKGIFDHLTTAKRVLYVEDLKELENPSEAEIMLLNKGIRSYMLSPLIDENDNIVSVLELASTKPNTFNYRVAPKLQPVFDQLYLSFESYSNELDNRVTSIIQKNFTSIHPSVEWKFEEVAKEYYTKKQAGENGLAMAPIVFKNVFPLYGQSDIVNSSAIRNEAIKSDLTENLIALNELVEKWISQKKLHLLESYHVKIKKILRSLEKAFIATDESKIVKLIVEDIHPTLEKMKERYPDLSNKAYEEYRNLLDDKLDIIYHKRKNFEQSVTKLNSSIAEFMEKDEVEMQTVLPHYFEKYKTDGVEYNLYIGQSILKNGTFTKDDLKNFRLWQLVNSCEVARLVNSLSPELDMPLKTAELIFVYNNPLSIKFRMDEKKFDVDGAYNVRYEILKKRIDKAVIKGTKERLTQSGKIAIVYLSEKDKLEYLDFLVYLKEYGYIEEEVEELVLDKLQGAEGLKALRVTVKY